MVGKAESGLMVCTPTPAMLKLIVPPPMLLASVIACRNEPASLSLVLVTVKTGAAGWRTTVPVSLATVGAGSFSPSTCVGRVERIVRKAFAKVEANRIDEIDNSATAKVIRSAKAREEAFFFILFFAVKFGKSAPGIQGSLTGKQAQILRKKM